MKRSEIFDNFVKIAQEKGLVSNDSSEAKKKLEQTRRAGSDDVSTIEALYGVKSDAAKGMDYKSNIMEAAHPNSVVVSPSYDKLHGLVENNIERQNILLNIVNKPVNGNATQHKYAEKELILSLVRIGNDLDDGSNERLRALADTCLAQMKPLKKKAKLKKTAQDPITLGVGLVVVTLVGVYLKNHLPFINDGFEQNHEKLVAELDDIINAGDTTLGVGYKYKPAFLQEMGNFRNKLEEFFNITQSVMPIIEKIETPSSGKELMEESKRTNVNEVKQAYDKYRTAYMNFLPYIKDVLKNFASEDYKLRQIEEKGFLSKIVDAPQILHGGKGLVADDFDDVRHALTTYRNSLVEIAKVLRGAQSLQQQATQKLQASMHEGRSDMPDLSPDSSTPQNPSAPAQKQETTEDLDQKADQLSKGLESFKGLFGG